MSSSVEFHLPESLTISQAHALHDDFESLLDKNAYAEIIVHADKVGRADTAGIQLLLAFVRITRERHIDVTWDKPSESLQEAAGILGLSSELGLH